ncbi:ferrous iron transport protein B [Desulfohalobiaceae bacterium Ax17]|uniref:ferrous iron transport protein B n=1 Tax=Desulfovulcanus ferrireducens TaxID=2831190 RepID=UPI00207BBEB9|nr:ferrous iron transport protein B [Desulfovulcanus ferrireducens]MBT8763384.1 ferrous iron transport protein B [Desulfovulcanus ferrireducens]
MSKKKIIIALAGNPNSGKTTLFNSLTGSRQHVGNYPGITVEKKEGFIEVQDRLLHFVDLPGTYSLTAYSQEELVARNFLAKEKPDLVVDVLNAGALERNLYLAVQIMELGIPVILALNMMDEVRQKGLTINTELLSKRLKVPVVETVARQGLGKDLLIQNIIELADSSAGSWTPLNISYGPDLDPVLQQMTEKIEQNHFLTNLYPPRWTALKYLEGDDEIRALGLKTNKTLARELEQAATRIAEHCQKTLNTYPEAIVADYRYGFISSLLKDVIKRDTHKERIAISDRIDRVLTHKFFGPLIMALILYAIYKFTFWLGEIPMNWVENLFAWMADTATSLIPPGLLQSMVVSGIIGGVGGVLSFVPLIALMFMCIAFLEDSGYMARVAYMLDRVFRIFGLHGCSVMPFIISGGIAGGCAVPGVMATRTLRSPKEKLATLLTVPFMPCGAKLPVFILLVGVFFPKNKPTVLFLISMTAWAAALIVSRILRSTIIRGAPTPFVMELPPYRYPTLRGLLIHTWERTWQYIKKAGTVILAISILLWAAMTFPSLPDDQVHKFTQHKTEIERQIQEVKAQNGDQAIILKLNQLLTQLDANLAQERLRYSLAGRLGTLLEPVTRWAGFDWKINISLIGGFAAKEVIVSTLGTAYSLGQVEVEEPISLADKIARDPGWDVKRAVSLILFILLYAPCLVTIVAIAKETGSWHWALFSMVFNTLFAFVLATAVYQGMSLLGN